jgi:hypothetical protein
MYEGPAQVDALANEARIFSPDLEKAGKTKKNRVFSNILRITLQNVNNKYVEYDAIAVHGAPDQGAGFPGSENSDDVTPFMKLAAIRQIDPLDEDRLANLGEEVTDKKWLPDHAAVEGVAWAVQNNKVLSSFHPIFSLSFNDAGHDTAVFLNFINLGLLTAVKFLYFSGLVSLD